MSYERNERPIDPAWLTFSDGRYSAQLHTEDEYFQAEEDHPDGLYMDALVDRLEPDERTCIELGVFSGLSYRDVATWLDWHCCDPPRPDGKKAWRVSKRALKKLKRMMEDERAKVRVSL